MSVNTAAKINKHHLIQQYKMQNKHLLNMVQKTKKEKQSIGIQLLQYMLEHSSHHYGWNLQDPVQNMGAPLSHT